MRRVLDDRYP
jgi:hypothetical protein